MVARINREIAERLLNEIRIHEADAGGKTVCILGSKGSGKTHLMSRLASQMTYIHPEKQIPVRETVIWRGRGLDYWSWMYYPDFEWDAPEFRRKVYVHYHVDDDPVFIDELGQPIRFPPGAIRTYRSVVDLHQNLVRGEINVVYEPTKYVMSRGLSEVLVARSCSKLGSLNGIVFDPALWWVDFLFYFLEFKKAGFVTVFLDEADEVFPATPSGIRWHLHGVFCDTVKDFRKANISFILSCHDKADLEYRLQSKIQYYGYMRGARPKAGSLLTKTATIMLPIGNIILERDGYGETNLGKLQERPRVRTLFLTGTGDRSAWEEPAEMFDDESLTCPRCGYIWTPRVVGPTRCPKCHAYLAYDAGLDLLEG